MGFSKGGGKNIFCAQNPGTVLDIGVTLLFENVFIGRNNMRDVLHEADVAAVNTGQGESLYRCPLGSKIT